VSSANIFSWQWFGLVCHGSGYQTKLILGKILEGSGKYTIQILKDLTYGRDMYCLRVMSKNNINIRLSRVPYSNLEMYRA